MRIFRNCITLFSFDLLKSYERFINFENGIRIRDIRDRACRSLSHRLPEQTAMHKTFPLGRKDNAITY